MADHILDGERFLQLIAESSTERAFDGKFYTEATRIKFQARPKAFFDVNRPRFVAGYVFKDRKLFFEIWYFPQQSNFKIVDMFGRVVKGEEGGSRGYQHMNDAVDDLLYIIAQEEPDLDPDQINVSRLSQDFVQGRFTESVDVNALLESTEATRAMLNTMLKGNVKEYSQTRVWKYKRNPFLFFIPQRKHLPTDFTGGIINAIMKLINRNRDAQFVSGYTYANVIDVEIWYVKAGIFGNDAIRGGFYVFDLTGGRILARNLSSIRWAVYEIARKLGALDTRNPELEQAWLQDQAMKRLGMQGVSGGMT